MNKKVNKPDEWDEAVYARMRLLAQHQASCESSDKRTRPTVPLKTPNVADLGRAFAQLKDVAPRQARVAEMYCLDDMDLLEIAERLNLTEETVRRDWEAISEWVENHSK